jgi:hypothetical protein
MLPRSKVKPAILAAKNRRASAVVGPKAKPWWFWPFKKPKGELVVFVCVRLQMRPGEPSAPAPGSPLGEVMKHRLKTAEGKAKYKLRQQTVEPIFGIIKSVMGFRQFLLRGLEKAGLEWQLVCLAYNLKRLHIMNVGQKLASHA